MSSNDNSCQHTHYFIDRAVQIIIFNSRTNESKTISNGRLSTCSWFLNRSPTSRQYTPPRNALYCYVVAASLRSGLIRPVCRPKWREIIKGHSCDSPPLEIVSCVSCRCEMGSVHAKRRRPPFLTRKSHHTIFP